MNNTQIFVVLIAACTLSLSFFMYYLRYSRLLEAENTNLKTENAQLKTENRQLRIISLATLPEIENRLKLIAA